MSIQESFYNSSLPDETVPLKAGIYCRFAGTKRAGSTMELRHATVAADFSRGASGDLLPSEYSTTRLIRQLKNGRRLYLLPPRGLQRGLYQARFLMLPAPT